MSAMRRVAVAHLRRHPSEAAKLLERLEPDEVARVLEQGPVDVTAKVFGRLAPGFAADCALKIPQGVRSALFMEAPTAIAAAVLRQMEPAQCGNELEHMPKALRDPLEQNLNFQQDTAGALADAAALTLHSDLTVAESLLRVQSGPRPIPSRFFVVDRSHRLVGAVTPGDLVGGLPDRTLDSLDLAPAHAVAANMPASSMNSAGQIDGPIAVVDGEDVFVGIIDEETLRRIGQSDAAASLLHPAAAIGELYWLGLRDIFGGFDSGARSAVRQGDTDRVNS